MQSWCTLLFCENIKQNHENRISIVCPNRDSNGLLYKMHVRRVTFYVSTDYLRKMYFRKKILKFCTISFLATRRTARVATVQTPPLH